MLARDVPKDPSASPDIVLRIGYQTLRSMIATRSGFAR
jgi:hypothetical protein